ncbi:deoxyribonuclease V [Picosynechococcus sp. NKBG15041c]|uniref:deoxyribonuclease V n=1 Tax=Picosynechococcus sp. NKBG15041c TaxID=1407650 RepID=UPI00041E027B|nr:deoxyribonuclease V [Picosynechococcus sp. NKBG15041c]
MILSLHHGHAWDVSPAIARDLQASLQQWVITENRLPSNITTIVGVDVGFEEQFTVTRAAAVLLTFPELTVSATAIATRPTTFPYVPGLLSFREVPTIFDALAQLPQLPDLIFCDGHGYAHPRRFGLACHLGVLLDLPTIGIAKSRYIGIHSDVPLEKGAWVPLEDQGEIIGAVLRSRTKVRPLYISVGHRLDLATALGLVLACTPKYRLPEPTRLADKLASRR